MINLLFSAYNAEYRMEDEYIKLLFMFSFDELK